MKRKSLIPLLLVLLSTSFMHTVYAQPVESSPVYVNSPIPYIDNDLDEGSGERVLWSNYTNMFYIFTHFDHDIVQHSETHPIIGYAYSPDGINFVVIDDFFEEISTHARATRGNFDVALSPDNRYVWFAWTHELGTYDSVYIVKCELLQNGSINPLTTEQLVVSGVTGAGHVEGYIDIEISSLGYPFVAYCTHKTSPYIAYFAYCRWSNYDNGTWILSGSDTFDSCLTWNKDDNYIEFSKLLRLEDGKMGWACDFADSIGNQIWKLHVAWFDGTEWLPTTADGLYGDGVATAIHGYKRTDTASYNDTVIGIYVKRDTGKQRCYVEQASYNSPFGTKITIIDDYPELVGNFNPNIVSDHVGNIIVTLFKNGASSVNYTYRFSNGTWNGLLRPNLVKWYANESQVFNWDEFTCSERFDNFLGFVYHDNSYGDMEILFDYMSFNGSILPVIAEHFNTTLYNADGSLNDGWIFKGEIYYFESYFYGADDFYLNFSDGQHDIKFRFINESKSVYLEEDGQFVIGDIFTNYTLFDDGTQRVQWKFIPDINIVDIVNCTVDYYIYNEEYSATLTGNTGISFNIYNLGGLTYYTFVGDGGRTIGGTPFELYATDGNISSSARAEQIFRKLQSVHFLMELDMSNEWESGNGEFDIDAGVGFVEVGIDYRLNQSWITGWKAKIYVQSADVGHHNAGVDKDWVEWSIDWYNYDPTYGYATNKRSELIYSNHWGYDNENADPTYHNRTSAQLFIDLWFDRVNASTTVAGQVNSYYYGMYEQGSAWWFGYGTFRPMIGEYENSKFLDDLYDEGGNITNCQKYELMKFWMKVEKVNITDGNDETWTIRAIEDMNREQAIDRMEGIDEPTFVETRVLDMPQTGFIHAIKSAIGGISSAIWKGAFQFIKLLMGAVGYLMDAIGLGEWWIAFNTVIENIGVFSMKLMNDLQEAFINTAILIEQMFRMISTGFGKFTYAISNFISSILDWYSYMADMFSGGGIFNINIWLSLNLEDFFILGMNLLPFWWLDRINKSNDKLLTVKNDLNLVLWTITGLFNFLVTLIMLSVALLDLLIGLLPI